MSVQITFLGRLGNNLFQYALGRIIAEHHGLSLTCLPNPDPQISFIGRRLDFGPSATLTDLAAHFPNAPLSIPGESFVEPVERLEYRRDGGWTGQTIDLAGLLANGTRRRIALAGFFQRYEYFAPYEQRIREWFRVEPIPIPWTLTARDTVVNVRRGLDYGIKDWTLSLSYYERVLARIRDPGQVYVCGTCVDAQVRRVLDKYHAIYYEGTPIEHFSFMTRFNRIILSNSTFAWWAAFLSEATEVYAPRSPDGLCYGFTGFEDVDLHTHESRYIEVGDTEIAPFAPFLPSAAVMVRAPGHGRWATPPGAGSSAPLRLDDSSQDLLTWMVHENKPIPLAEIRLRFTSLDVNATFRRLVKAGLIEAEARYLDDVLL